MQNFIKKIKSSKKNQLYFSDQDDMDSLFVKRSQKTKIDQQQDHDELVDPRPFQKSLNQLKKFKYIRDNYFKQKNKQMDLESDQSDSDSMQDCFNSNENVQKKQRRLLNNEEVQTLLANIRKSKLIKKKQEEQNKIARIDMKNRKIRTPVSQQKILLMEHLFPYIIEGKPYKGTQLSLKDVAKLANLGYSTVLHKFKNYRDQGNVKKGVLLKCKDFKRKYNKSMAMQNYIKEAMTLRNFKTASELAAFIRKQFNVNCNRSIVSRHLNEMQRDKFQFFGDVQLQKQQISKTQKEKNWSALVKFKKIFFGLRQNITKFHYITVIPIYHLIVNGQLEINEYNLQTKNYKTINLVIRCTQTQIISFQSDHAQHLIKTEGNIFQKDKSNDLIKTYECLYHEVQKLIFDETFFLSNLLKEQDQLKDQSYAYFVFPHNNSNQQNSVRKLIIQKIMRNQLTMMIMPLKVKNINFIRNWFINEVYEKNLKNMKFQSLQYYQKQIERIMRQNQFLLKNYALNMTQGIKKL